MAIKGADLIQVGDRFLLQRAQSAGPGQVNLSPEKVYELGNYQSIATIFDIPDLTFSIDSLDASASLEAKLTGQDPATMTSGQVFDLSLSKPIDILNQFKRGRLDANPYNVAASVALPYLTLEQVNYRFGLKEKAQQTAVLKGDSIFYNPGSAYQDVFVGTNAANQTVTLTQPAYPYNGAVLDGTKYALGVKLMVAGKRLRFGSDYTEAVTGTATDGSRSVTLTILAPVPTTDSIDVVYSSPTVATYPQASNTVPSTTLPAALRGRDIEVYVGGIALSNRWTSVQAVTCDFRVTLERNEEFGNTQLVSQDFEVPTVNGTIQLRPRDVFELLTRVRQAASVSSATEVVGAITTTPLEIVFVLHSPVDGSILKSIVIPDARITVPAYSGRVQSKLDVTFSYESDTGRISVINAAKPLS